MKFLEAVMSIFQYANYRMVEWDNKPWGGASKSWRVPSEMKAIFLFGTVELCIAFALYCVIYHVVLARPVYIPSNPILLIVLCIVGLAMTLINQSILGPESRTRHYRKIFEAWDKKKQMRWNLYLVLILLLSLSACIHEMGVNVKMLHSG
jgi:hypothetical protein